MKSGSKETFDVQLVIETGESELLIHFLDLIIRMWITESGCIENTHTPVDLALMATDRDVNECGLSILDAIVKRKNTAELFFVLMKQLWNGFRFSCAAALRNGFIIIVTEACARPAPIWGYVDSFSGSPSCKLKPRNCPVHWLSLVWRIRTIFQLQISLRTAFRFLLRLTWRFVQPGLKSVWTKQSPAIFLRSQTLQPKRKHYPQLAPEYSAQVSYTLKRL